MFFCTVLTKFSNFLAKLKHSFWGKLKRYLHSFSQRSPSSKFSMHGIFFPYMEKNFHAWKKNSIGACNWPYTMTGMLLMWSKLYLWDQREQIWVILYSWLYKLPSKISCDWYRYRTSFTIFSAINNCFIRGCEHLRNIPISCKVSFRLPGKPFLSIHGIFFPCMEKNFHVWKKNSTHGNVRWRTSKCQKIW